MSLNHTQGELYLKLGPKNNALHWKLTNVGWNQELPFSYCTPNAAKRLRLQAYILPVSREKSVMTTFGLVFVQRMVVLQVETDTYGTLSPNASIVELRIGLADIPAVLDDPDGSVVFGLTALEKPRFEQLLCTISMPGRPLPDSLQGNPQDDH